MTELQRTALEAARGKSATPGEIERVAKLTDPVNAAWAFTQWELRKKAKAKFVEPDRMLFEREALEQATHFSIARYHAGQFPKGALVHDLTTGIGGDLIELAKRGPAVGYELDPARAKFARFNLAAFELSAEVRVQDALTADLGGGYAFADPARRVMGHRTLDPSQFSPHPQELAERFRILQLGLIKLSPMMPDPYLQSLAPSRRFLSFGGECREVLVFLGGECTGQEKSPQVFAVHIESGDHLVVRGAPKSTPRPQSFLYDADPAAVRAGALGTLCEEHGLLALGDSNGYLTGEMLVKSHWLRPYRVLASQAADLAKTLKSLRALDAATPEWKQRGSHLDLIAMRKRMKLEGTRSLSVAIWPIGKSLQHTILEPI